MRTSRVRHLAAYAEYSEELERMESAHAESVHELWKRSYEAERDGEISAALEIHEQILSRIGTSYAACLRAGRLHCRAGGYRRSLSYYIKALLLSPGDGAPLRGMMNCHLAMGNRDAAAQAVSALHAVEAASRSPGHQIAV